MGLSGFNRQRASNPQDVGNLPSLINQSASPNPTQPLRAKREAQLRSMHWKTLAAIAAKNSFPPKPETCGWHDHCIPLILKKEGY